MLLDTRLQSSAVIHARLGAKLLVLYMDCCNWFDTFDTQVGGTPREKGLGTTTIGHKPPALVAATLICVA